jgi:hypothetical protein
VEVASRQRIAASRKSNRTSARVVVGATLVMAGLLLLINQGYLAPFDTLNGQAWRQVAAGLAVDTAARLDDEGRLHAQKVTAVPDPPSLVDLRKRVEAMLPRIDLGELILEVMAWYPGFADAFTALSGSATRLGPGL